MEIRILALDPATKTGWKSPTSHGVFNLKLRSNESKGLKFIKFRSKIREVMLKDNITIVAYERPGGRHYNGLRSHANFEGIIMTACEDMEIEYRDYSAGEIKTFAKETWIEMFSLPHKGHVKKEHMIKYAEECFGIEIIDDNHADALWLYALAESELN